MGSFTNRSKATRIVNVKVDGRVTQKALAPGATLDGDIIVTKSLQAAINAGKGSAKAEAKPEPKAQAKSDAKSDK